MGIHNVFVPGRKRELPAARVRRSSDVRSTTMGPDIGSGAMASWFTTTTRPQASAGSKVYEPLSQVDFGNFARPSYYFPAVERQCGNLGVLQGGEPPVVPRPGSKARVRVVVFRFPPEGEQRHRMLDAIRQEAPIGKYVQHKARTTRHESLQ